MTEAILNGKFGFAMEGGLTDLISQLIPNHKRSSSIMMEKLVDDNVQLYEIGAEYPAIYYEDAAWETQPAGVNLLTWNIALNENVWVKGDNINVKADRATAPHASFLADRVTWTGSTSTDPILQTIRRTLNLEAGRQYYLSALLKLEGGQFSRGDVIRITGDVVGSPSVSLSGLNEFPKRYRWVEIPFTAGGRQPTSLPYDPNSGSKAVTVTSASGQNFGFTTTNAIGANDLAGSQVIFSNIPDKRYLVSANTAVVNGASTVTISGTDNLATDGVNSTSRAMFTGPPKQVVNVEIFSQSTATIDWGGMQVEAYPFRTSMIFQQAEIKTRSSTYMFYRKNPIAGLRTFGVFVDMKLWRGDGDIFNMGNFKAWIENRTLYVQAGATTVSAASPLTPNQPVQLFAQIAAENLSLSLYVDGILQAKATVNEFTGSQTDPFYLESKGIRAYHRIIVTDSLLVDGQPSVGQRAGQEVLTLFEDENLIDAEAVSAHSPAFTLLPVVIPAPDSPIATSLIEGINSANKTVTVSAEEAPKYVISAPVSIVRDNKVILSATVTNKSGTLIYLDTVSAIVIGDQLIYGNVDKPGQASARFPFEPIDPQIVQEIDTLRKKVRLSSSAAFSKQKAFVWSPNYQDVAEVLVTDVDPINRQITLESLAGIELGFTMAQPKDRSELIISIQNYFVDLLDPVEGINIEKYENGVVYYNTNKVPVEVVGICRVTL